jgi:hypothetical protein
MSGQNETLFKLGQTSTSKAGVIALRDFTAMRFGSRRDPRVHRADSLRQPHAHSLPARRMHQRRAVCMIVGQRFLSAPAMRRSSLLKAE